MDAKTVVVSGSSGLVGKALSETLRSQGHRVLRLVRSRDAARASDAIYWNVRDREIETSALEGVNAVVHLAGETIADRWSEAKKRRIRDSRVHGTDLLADALSSLSAKPEVLVSCSATGFYGDAGDTVLTEESPQGAGFLAGVCGEWEAAAAPAEAAGIRVVYPRVGIVLSKRGGMLAKMVPPFKLGLGGRVGDGRQFMSWIRLEDLVSALCFVIHHTEIRGVINATAPEPVRNETFTDALGEALRRPTFIPLPKFAAKLALGAEMTNELLLGSQRAVPRALQDAGFEFEYPTLGRALATLRL